PAVPPDRTGGTETRATLEEQQPRQVRVRLARRDDLAREHLDVLAVGTAVVQRDTERVVGQHGARLAVARHVPTVRPGPAIRPLYGVRPGPAHVPGPWAATRCGGRCSATTRREPPCHPFPRPPRRRSGVSCTPPAGAAPCSGCR